MSAVQQAVAASHTIFVSTTSALAAMLATLADLPTTPPSLYIDLEGESLSRKGTIALLTLYVSPHDIVYLVDVHALRASTFSTPAYAPKQTRTPPPTLKSILESPHIPKVFFDVRNDSDALFAHYAIALSCIHDLQVMELATPTLISKKSRTFLSSLSTCIQYNARLSPAHLVAWRASKDTGNALFDPQKGGSYAVFEDRPLTPPVEQYCVQDVVIMPLLWRVFQARLQNDRLFEAMMARIKGYAGFWETMEGAAGFWETMARETARHRVEISWETWYRPCGAQKKVGCWSEVQIQEARERWSRGERSGLCD